MEQRKTGNNEDGGKKKRRKSAINQQGDLVIENISLSAPGCTDTKGNLAP